jgi:hypothetical protein
MDDFRTVPWAAALLTLTTFAATAAEPARVDASATAGVAQNLLAEIRAANVARADLEREKAAWAAERQRLSALRDGVVAEGARLTTEAATAEAATATADAELRRLDSASDLTAARDRLQTLAETIRLRLVELAQKLPPGAVTVPPQGCDFTAAIHAIEVTERAASSVAIEVVTGTLHGAPMAVRLLRVAGAACWWGSFDQTQAGTAHLAANGWQLEAVADPQPILHAIAQAEARTRATILTLPLSGVLSPGAVP